MTLKVILMFSFKKSKIVKNTESIENNGIKKTSDDWKEIKSTTKVKGKEKLMISIVFC